MRGEQEPQSQEVPSSFHPEQKAAIVRRHLVDKVPVSDLCDEYKIQPSMLYTWQKAVVDGAARVFESPPERGRPITRESELTNRIQLLEAKLTKKDAIIAEISEEYVTLKGAWGTLSGHWVPHDTRDAVVDFVDEWSTKTEIAQERFVGWLGVSRGKFFAWKQRYGKANEHNGKVPRDHWLDEWEQQAILAYHQSHPLRAIGRMTFMMLNEDVVAVSPASDYRVLSKAGVLDSWNKKPSKKGTGFVQPQRPHDHWHIDIAYLNVAAAARPPPAPSAPCVPLGRLRFAFMG